MTDDRTVRIERTFQAPVEAVFEAWTSVEVIRRWWHAAHHWETTEAQVDLRVGGVVRVVMRDPDKDAEYGGGGHYTEVAPPTRLAFTWTLGRRHEANADRDRFRGDRRHHHRHPHPQRPVGTRRQCARTRTGGARSSTTSSAPWRRLVQRDSPRTPAFRDGLVSRLGRRRSRLGRDAVRPRRCRTRACFSAEGASVSAHHVGAHEPA